MIDIQQSQIITVTDEDVEILKAVCAFARYFIEGERRNPEYRVSPDKSIGGKFPKAVLRMDGFISQVEAA